MFWAIPNMAHTSLMNFDVKWGSLSLITREGSPKCRKTWLMYSRAISLAVVSSQQGMKMAAFVQSCSVMVRTSLDPFDRGSLVLKSNAMVSNGITADFVSIGTNSVCSGNIV